MNKIFLVVLATVILTSCGSTSSHSSKYGNVNINAICYKTGYAVNDAGNCVPELAAPVLATVTSGLGGMTISFASVKDLNSNTVTTGKVHFIYKNMATATNMPVNNTIIDANTCNNYYTDTVDCSISTAHIYPPALQILTAGNYCLKAIACGGEDYKDSEILVTLVVVPTSTIGNGV